MGRLHDLRGQRAEMPVIYDPGCDGAKQSLGRSLCGQGSAGVVYDSVRRGLDLRSQCAAFFEPAALRNARAAFATRLSAEQPHGPPRSGV